jgi:peptidoglycan/LPS O-acetylase OafA/YrhL
MNWIASALAVALIGFLWEIAGEAMFALGAAISAPVRRPVWALFMRARWPWPAAVLAAFGIAAAGVGAMLLQKPNSSSWENGLGVALFLGGAFLTLAGPALWFHERNRATNSNGADADQPAS